MKLLDIINAPWAITQKAYREIADIYQVHMKGDYIDIKGLEEKYQIRFQDTVSQKEKDLYDVVNGKAVISILNVISKRLNFFSWLFGGTSAEMVGQAMEAAMNDSSIDEIILYIDSPGGTVDGTFELSDLIYSLRGTKPITAFTDGMMASAAYAIGSAADKIYISGNTTQIGSIGVITMHVDWSEAFKKAGVKVTEIKRGKYKAVGSPYKSLDKDSKDMIQEEIDYLYTVFVDTVAKNRGIAAEMVLSQMSTDVKPIFIGEQAIEAGLADGVSTMALLIDKDTGGSPAIKPSAIDQSKINNWIEDRLASDKKKTSAGSADEEKEEVIMNIEELKAKHPDLYKSIFEDGKTTGHGEGHKAGLEEGLEQGRKEGADQEMARIKSVKDQMIPGHEALVETLMFDGATTGEQAAVKILAVEKQIKDKKLDNFKEDGEDIDVTAATSPEIETTAEGEDAKLPLEDRAKATWDKDPKIREEFRNFDVYLAFRKNEKNARVLSKK